MRGPRGAPEDAKSLRATASKGLVRRIAATFRPYRGTVAIVGLLILFTAGLGVVNPLLIRVVFDSALFLDAGPDLGLLWVIAGVMALITVVTGGLGIVQTFLTNRVGQRVMRDLRDRLYEHLQSLSLSFFTDTRTGEIQSRVANDVGGVQNVVTSTVSNVLSNSVIFISTLIAMFILSWQLALVSIAMVPIFAALSKTVGARRRAVSAETQKSAADVTAITQETLSISGVLLAKLFGRQNQEIRRFHAENQRLTDLTMKRVMTGQAFFTSMQVFFSLTPVVVYVLAGYMVSGSGPAGLSPGTIVAFTTLQARLYFPIGSLLQVSVELQASLALFERIFGYLDIESDIVDAPDAIELKRTSAKGKVTFDNVRLSYAAPRESAATDNGDSAQRWALDRVSLEVQPGQLIALVGPSGAGKTTISYLIPRLYDVTEGAVRIDDVDVRNIRLASLAGLIGYVSQETYLFHASLRSNLLYGNPDATQKELEEAAKTAFIHDRILEFPDGYDTVVGERGYRPCPEARGSGCRSLGWFSTSRRS